MQRLLRSGFGDPRAVLWKTIEQRCCRVIGLSFARHTHTCCVLCTIPIRRIVETELDQVNHCFHETLEASGQLPQRWSILL